MGWVKDKGGSSKFQFGGQVPAVPRVGPQVPMYEEGGKVSAYEKNKAKREAMKKRRAKAIDERKAKRTAKKITKRALKLEKKTPGAGSKYVKMGPKSDVSKLKTTGKIRKKSTSVTLTEGGAYATYKKKSKAAGSFRKAFAAAKGKDFTWDGRKYSGKKK